jgi:hypothetical protein
MTHLHHIIPRHAGGTDDSNNLFPLSITQHALAHRNRAIIHVSPLDWIAWKSLSRQITHDEARRRAASVANSKPKSPQQIEKMRQNCAKSLIGRKRPEHSQLMKTLGIKPPVGSRKGLHNTEEHKQLAGSKSGQTRLGKKRGPYNIKNRNTN